MKYWIFHNNQVNGPHEAEDLAQLPSFSPEALVCPEGRKGTSMGDWQRAGMLPELSIALLKASQLTAAAAAGPRGGGYASLPPEPTLRDLAALGSLQEKIALLEGALSELQEGLRRKDSELLGLHKELEEKKRTEADLLSKLGSLEERLTAVSKMRSTLDEAVAAEKSVEGVVERQRQTMDELTRGLEILKEERAQMRNRIEEAVSAEKTVEGIVERQRQAIEELTRTLEAVKEERAHDKELLRPVIPPPAPAISSEPLPPPPPPLPAAAVVPPSPAPTAAPADIPADIKEAPPLEAPSPAEAPPQAPKSKKGLLAASAAAVLVIAALAALQFDLIGLGKKAPPPAEEPAPAPLEAPPAPPEVSSAEAQLEALKQQAVDLVRMWPSGDGVKTVGQRLEGDAPAEGLSPWMAEKLAEGLFQVNFYSKSAGAGGGTIHEFQVRPGEKQVSALNLAAKAILEKEQAPPAAPAKPRRVRVRPKAKKISAPEQETPAQKQAADAGLLDDLLKP